MAAILLLEDDDQVAQLVCDIGETMGHAIDRSATAYDAVLKMHAANLQYALVIVDLLLHGANGIAGALALRGLGYAGPIIVTTGNLLPIHQAVYDSVGFSGRLLKPFTLDDLKNEITKQLGMGEEAHEGRGRGSQAF